MWFIIIPEGEADQVTIILVHPGKRTVDILSTKRLSGKRGKCALANSGGAERASNFHFIFPKSRQDWRNNGAEGGGRIKVRLIATRQRRGDRRRGIAGENPGEEGRAAIGRGRGGIRNLGLGRIGG